MSNEEFEFPLASLGKAGPCLRNHPSQMFPPGFAAPPTAPVNNAGPAMAGVAPPAGGPGGQPRLPPVPMPFGPGLDARTHSFFHVHWVRQFSLLGFECAVFGCVCLSVRLRACACLLIPFVPLRSHSFIVYSLLVAGSCEVLVMFPGVICA